MAITKEKKVEIIQNLKEATKAKSVVFVNFKGLTVAEVTNLRRKLKEEKLNYKVAKKTLFKKVLGEAKIEGEMPPLNGELAIAYGEDELAPAREIYEFQKKFSGKVSIVGGIFGGRYMRQEEMVSIASIPSLQVLRGMFVNIINSPIQRLALVINEIALKRG
jgi:large subunit ribosomal protein L10